MATPLVPQEIFLLERYASAEYFGAMRDAWSAAVAHAERCLDAFVHALPADYRSRPLCDQPDIVWGERVLPNFRSTRQLLDTAFIRITHGDLDALGFASNVLSDVAAFSRDYSAAWMDELPVMRVVGGGADAFSQYMSQATGRASNISFTALAEWTLGSLREAYNAEARGPLSPPAQWPLYRLGPATRATTDAPAPRTGIYLPDANDAVAALLIEGVEAPPATVGLNAVTMQRLRTEPTTWTLVERVGDTGGGTPGDPDPVRAGVRLRCEAGQPCPRAGYWSTPARPGSRRSFAAGELMPDTGGDYGAVIWQWDDDQR